MARSVRRSRYVGSDSRNCTFFVNSVSLSRSQVYAPQEKVDPRGVHIIMIFNEASISSECLSHGFPVEKSKRLSCIIRDFPPAEFP